MRSVTIAVGLLLVATSTARAQFYQPYQVPQQQFATNYPPYPPYPPPTPGGFGGCPGGHAGDGRTYESALIQLIAIQQLLNQQSEVNRGLHDRTHDQLGTIIRQQEFARFGVGLREQFDWSRSLAQQPYPAPPPVIIQPPARRRGLFR